ncbi:AmmeMemoRadiSam system radical SAM enzyme [Acidihalobacter aeolianus]|uniref:AmmeMemoRadiSam system radical SAM enzyme n=1 Tax=Acidihalobacter aeolianus TaxID=2792603 RepID=A0A1D8K4Q0_9GAMM|nr:AmmeMemoRadiSam system radical SAM enzyme [Acidihalobacter aeolianus]AOV15939.1 AmmeMemoRadiSam system radical SAM enzyme [Acidihalobacter aeolianus]
MMATSTVATRYWHALDDGRVQCDLCPRFCTLHEGQQGLCFVRANQGGEIVLTSYGRSSGFVIDPIEKKPLNHFLPGSGVLSFGTAGCNLACKFCQNWDMSKARDMDRLMDQANPAELAEAALSHGARSLAFTYNDPVIFMEYAVDVAIEARRRGVRSVAVTAGYVTDAPRVEFFRHMDAANIDLKAFDEDFYYKLCGAHLQPVLETIEYAVKETDCWVELTTLLIPGHNDSAGEIERLSAWVAERLGSDVPLHFSAFHPDYRMAGVPRTPPETLRRAREIARAQGLHHVYTGNVHDEDGGNTYCAGCGHRLIGRDRYTITDWQLVDGCCPACGERLAGVFEAQPGDWGARRQPVRIAPA